MLVSGAFEVAHVSSAHPWTDNRVHLREAASLARAGFPTTLIAVESSTAVPATGVKVRTIRRRGRLPRMALSSVEAVAVAVSSGARVVHLHDPELSWAIPLLRVLGRTVVFDAHEDLPDQVLSKHYVRPALRRPLHLFARLLVRLQASASHVVAATETIALRFPPGRTTVVQNFPRLRFAEDGAQAVSKRSPRVAYIGALDTARGGFTLANVPTSADFPKSWTFEFAGTVSAGALRELVAQRSASGSLVDHGQVSPAAARDLLLDARVGVVTFHPTEAHLNCLPTKMFEYMAAGLALIVSDFELWRRMLGPHDCATFVDPTDPGAIARAVAAYEADPSLLERHATNARIAAQTAFNWASEEKKLLDLYTTLLLDPSRKKK